jgi:hypothetical protein
MPTDAALMPDSKGPDSNVRVRAFDFGRGGGIRTHDLFVPNPDTSRLILADHAVFAGGTDELHRLPTEAHADRDAFPVRVASSSRLDMSGAALDATPLGGWPWTSKVHNMLRLPA